MWCVVLPKEVCVLEGFKITSLVCVCGCNLWLIT